MFEAAGETAELIKSMVPADVRLPRRYFVKEVISGTGSTARFLCREDFGVLRFVDDFGSSHLHKVPESWSFTENLITVLQFAFDVADGLLDEIKEWLDARDMKA